MAEMNRHPRYSDDFLVRAAQAFETRKEWEMHDFKTWRTASRRPAVYALATKHMHWNFGCKRKYTDDELIQIAQQFKHKVDWLNADYNTWQAASKLPELYKKATAHMVPKVSPYLAGYTVYAYEFSDHSAYIGVTFRPKDRYRVHLCEGPVKKHSGICASYVYKVLNEGISPVDAAKAEREFIQAYKVSGWNLLNIYAGGSLGSVNFKWPRKRVLEDALKFHNKTEWFNKSGYAYKLAKHYGCFEEATQHMRSPKRPATTEQQKQLMRVKMRQAWQNADNRLKWLKGMTKWTRARILTSAKLFTTITPWCRKHSAAYQAAKRNGWFDEAVAHMV